MWYQCSLENRLKKTSADLGQETIDLKMKADRRKGGDRRKKERARRS